MAPILLKKCSIIHNIQTKPCIFNQASCCMTENRVPCHLLKSLEMVNPFSISHKQHTDGMITISDPTFVFNGKNNYCINTGK